MLIEFAVTQISLETSIYGLLDKNGAMFYFCLSVVVVCTKYSVNIVQPVEL